MSLLLKTARITSDYPASPHGGQTTYLAAVAKTYGMDIGHLRANSVEIRAGGNPAPPLTVEIGADDMADLVEYWLTNTDLTAGDPRLQLVRRIQKMATVAGYNPQSERLAIRG